MKFVLLIIITLGVVFGEFEGYECEIDVGNKICLNEGNLFFQTRGSFEISKQY